jgi:hypothetical protein
VSQELSADEPIEQRGVLPLRLSRRRYVVSVGQARWPVLELAVRPEVLLGTLANEIFEHGD